MHAHELLNLLLRRLRYPVDLREITRVYNKSPASVEFVWSCHHLRACCPSPGGRIVVEHVLGEGIYQDSLQSRYVEKLLNGGKRNEAGELTEYFGPAA